MSAAPLLFPELALVEPEESFSPAGPGYPNDAVWVDGVSIRVLVNRRFAEMMQEAAVRPMRNGGSPGYVFVNLPNEVAAAVFGVRRGTYPLHRLVVSILGGSDGRRTSARQIDKNDHVAHADGNKLNCTRENLRATTHARNLRDRWSGASVYFNKGYRQYIASSAITIYPRESEFVPDLFLDVKRAASLASVSVSYRQAYEKSTGVPAVRVSLASPAQAVKRRGSGELARIAAERWAPIVNRFYRAIEAWEKVDPRLLTPDEVIG